MTYESIFLLLVALSGWGLFLLQAHRTAQVFTALNRMISDMELSLGKVKDEPTRKTKSDEAKKASDVLLGQIVTSE